MNIKTLTILSTIAILLCSCSANQLSELKDKAVIAGEKGKKAIFKAEVFVQKQAIKGVCANVSPEVLAVNFDTPKKLAGRELLCDDMNGDDQLLVDGDDNEL